MLSIASIHLSIWLRYSLDLAKQIDDLAHVSYVHGTGANCSRFFTDFMHKWKFLYSFNSLRSIDNEISKTSLSTKTRTNTASDAALCVQLLNICFRIFRNIIVSVESHISANNINQEGQWISRDFKSSLKAKITEIIRYLLKCSPSKGRRLKLLLSPFWYPQ